MSPISILKLRIEIGLIFSDVTSNKLRVGEVEKARGSVENRG
jgi:hypothetical protein